MAKICACPAGHDLQPYSAKIGTCDGCRGLVLDGDLVMDCRQCNYYLCNDCHNGRSPRSLWGTISSFIPDCKADSRVPAAAEAEIVIDANEPATAPVEDPRCNQRAAVVGEESQLAGSPEQAPEGAKGARGAKGKKGPKAQPKAAEPQVTTPKPELVDLLGDLDPQLAASGAEWTASFAAPVEIAAPPDLGLLDTKGQGESHANMQVARMGAA